MSEQKTTTPLHQAAKEGKAEKVKQLIAAGVDVNCQDEYGNTALKLASQGDGLFGGVTRYEKPEIIKMLIANGANVNIVDEDNSSPLLVASSWSDSKTFEDIAFLLMEAGADIHKTNNQNQSPIHLSGRNEKVSLELIRRGADINAVDSNHRTPLEYALFHHQSGKLVRTLLNSIEDITPIEALMQQNEEEIPVEHKIAWYSYQTKKNRLTVSQVIECIKNEVTAKNTWAKVCGLLDYAIENEELEKALRLDNSLTTKHIQIGYEHRYYPIYKISLYLKNGDTEKLELALSDMVIYGASYRLSESWRDKWNLTDKEFDELSEKLKEVSHKTYAKFYFDNARCYESYPIETRPFIWLEKTTLNRSKEKCVLSGKKLAKGSSVYKFRNLDQFGRFELDFFYADVADFEADPKAMENKTKFENNRYQMSDFAFYWLCEASPIIRSFWYHIDAFDFEKTLNFLSTPLHASSEFQHRYGNFIDGQGIIKREYEKNYHYETLISPKGAEYANIWHALIKCGYLEKIITYLPKLPKETPYLLLCFNHPQIREVEAYLGIKGIAEIFELVFKSYTHTNEKDLKKIIKFSQEHPRVAENLACMLNLYELHLYNCYAPSINWYCQAFAHFATAKGAGILDLFIPYPHLLKPLTLLLENGGELTGTAYSDTEIFFIRTILVYTALFNSSDMTRLFKSLHNGHDNDGNVYFSGMDEKVYNKTYRVIEKLVVNINKGS